MSSVRGRVAGCDAGRTHEVVILAPVHVDFARSRTKAATVLLGCLAFLAMAVFLMTTGPAGVVVGVLVGIVFGVFGVLWAALGFRPGPGLVVRDDGFDDRSSALSVGWVPWSDVHGLGTWTMSGNTCVVVHVADPVAYAARAPWWGRAAARANIRLVGSPIAITHAGLRTDHETLLATMAEASERWHERHPEG